MVKQNIRKTDKPKICIDKNLPYDPTTQLHAYQIAKAKNLRNIPEANIVDKMSLALVRAKFHKVGSTLTVKYLNGTQAQKDRTTEMAKDWENYANIKLEFQSNLSGNADIRIGFKWRNDVGSWSYIGTDIFNIPQQEATMNFGWLDVNGRDTTEYSRTVKHEFGHTLGCIHEHQNPSANIPWDKPAVYRYFQGPPNNWSKEDVDNNLFATYDSSKSQFSQFDKESIMLYAIDNSLTIGDYEVKGNTTLSAIDKSFIGTIYPKVDPTAPDSDHIINLGDTKKASIGAYLEEDYYEFELKSDLATRVNIYTEGPTDVVMSLVRADTTTVIAWDDDSGQGTNAKIIKTLNKGKYIIRVRHYSPRKIGDYSLTLKQQL